MQSGPRVYTRAEKQVWRELYTRQLKIIQDVSYTPFSQGLKALDFDGGRIPGFDQINQKLQRLTGWSIYPVEGLIDNRYFFEQMLERKFGSTQWLRKPEQIDYLEEPDMFHDVFGHIPLLTDPAIGEFLEGLAQIAGKKYRR